MAPKSDPLPPGAPSGFALGYSPQLRAMRSGGAFSQPEHPPPHQKEFLPEQLQDFFDPFVLRRGTDHPPLSGVEATTRGKLRLQRFMQRCH